MTFYSYKPLDFSKNEIRVLKFLDSSHTSNPELVHCTLENVSLDDYLPPFAELLAEKELDCGPAATRAWMEVGDSKPDHTNYSPSLQIPIACWRRDPYTLNLAAHGVTTEILPEREETSLRLTTLSSLEEAQPRGLEPPKVPTTFNFPSRYKWGDFEALSYLWGSDVREKTIIVDNKPLRIAKSLEGVLQRLQSLPETIAGMRIWADGVCIDQDNTYNEKNHQVALMKRIYTQSAAVIVWLGDLGPRGDEAIKAICQSALVKLKEDAAGYWKNGPVPVYWSPKSFQNWFDSLHWETVLHFLSLNYWRRMWIVQELGLNHNMTLFLYGDQQLPRIAIWAAAAFCQTYAGEIREAITKSSNKTRCDSENRVIDVWQLAYDVHLLFTICEFPNTPNLETVLDLSRKSKVKEAQDKVYGILGLLPESLVSKNQPDYSLTPVQVYSRMAKSLLEEQNGLEGLLSWCSFVSTSKDPSWVPDWSRPFQRNHLQHLRRRKASKEVTESWSVSSDGRMLCCKGILIDNLPTAQSMSSPPSKSYPFRTQVCDSTKEPSVSGEFGRYINKKGLRAALERTLRLDHPGATKDGNVLDIYWIDWNDIRDVDPENEQLSDLWYGMRNITAAQNTYFFGAWEAFDRFRHTNADYKIFAYCFRDFFPNMREYVRPMMFWKAPTLWDYPDRPDENYYLEDLTSNHARNMSISSLALMGRRLATTSKGYLGLVPEEASDGDKVAILHGCNFPVLLRPSGDAFQYIGECYLDGLMDGEAIEAKEKGVCESLNLRLY